MQKNVASQKLRVFAFDVTTNIAKTGDAANLTAYVSKDYGTVTVLGDTSATEESSTNAAGYYLFDLAQAETNADNLGFTCKSSTSNVVVICTPDNVDTVPPGFNTITIASNAVLAASPVSGTITLVQAVTGPVLLSAGTGAGQLDFTSGVVKANATQWLGGTIPAVNVTGVPLVDAKYLLGTIFSTPSTAGIMDINAKNWGNSAVTGMPMPTYTQPTGFLAATFPTGTIANTTNITAGTIATVTNLTNLPSIPTNWITAAGITAAALSGKGDWMISYAQPTGFLAATFPTSVASPTNITAVANLTNAPTVGDFTAAMKISLSSATPAVTVSDKTGFSLSSAGIQAIWDALTSALTTAGSVGKWIVSSLFPTSSYTVPDNAAAEAASTNATAALTILQGATAGTQSFASNYSLTQNASASISFTHTRISNVTLVDTTTNLTNGGGGGGGSSAADIWSYGNRTLTGSQQVIANRQTGFLIIAQGSSNLAISQTSFTFAKAANANNWPADLTNFTITLAVGPNPKAITPASPIPALGTGTVIVATGPTQSVQVDVTSLASAGLLAGVLNYIYEVWAVLGSESYMLENGVMTVVDDVRS